MSRPEVPRLHLVGPPAGVDAEKYLRVASKAARGGISAVHVRMPGAHVQDVLQFAQTLKRAISPILVIVNDRVDVALISDADGVHIGERGLPVMEVRRLVGGDVLIGRSIHDLDGAVTAENDGADYLIAGHIFQTSSKAGIAGRGVIWLRTIVDAVSVPVIAIGGIKPENVGAVMETGACGVAVSSNIVHAACPRERAAELLRHMQTSHGGKLYDNDERG